MKELKRLIQEHERCAIKFSTEPAPVDMEWARYMDAAAKAIEKRVRTLLFEAKTNNDVCWHCKDVLMPQVPRCEHCPAQGDCDDENCPHCYGSED